MYGGSTPVIFIPLLSETFFSSPSCSFSPISYSEVTAGRGVGGSKKFANFVLGEGQQGMAYSGERGADGVSNISTLRRTSECIW